MAAVPVSRRKPPPAPPPVRSDLPPVRQPRKPVAQAYRGTMYGEIGVGSHTWKPKGEMRFGAIAPDSTLADRKFTSRGATPNSYGTDEFSASGRRGYFARNSMVSSQASFNYGRKVAAEEGLRPSQVQFEHQRADGRRMDVSRPGATPGSRIDTEIKAAKGPHSGQVRRDEVFARTAGRTTEYVYTDNPNTRARGPSAAAHTRMATANARSGGHVTSAYKPEIAPKAATLKAVEVSSIASKAVRGAGKVAAPVGLVVDTVMIGPAVQADGGKFGAKTKVAVAGAAGGWAGAAGGAVAGAKLGALVGLLGGPAGAAVGGVVGGIAGGIAGGIGGASIGEALGKLW